jgi:3,4-dihydroxy-2-butanone 4-phosphate synthase
MAVTTPFATVEAAIEDIREGRMVVVVDDEDRENEGDLTIAAQFATPDAINFMATHARGLVCLCITEERADQLGLRPMTDHNEAPLGTAFTVSVEAREGVTTGISAADRSRTIQVAIHADSTPHDLVQPGHVFPLRAKPGGVLERIGQTEAAADLGLSTIRILTNNPKKLVGIDGFGLTVVEQVPIEVSPGSENQRYLETKRDKLGHRLHHQDLKNLDYEPEAE